MPRLKPRRPRVEATKVLSLLLRLLRRLLLPLPLPLRLRQFWRRLYLRLYLRLRRLLLLLLLLLLLHRTHISGSKVLRAELPPSLWPLRAYRNSHRFEALLLLSTVSEVALRTKGAARVVSAHC